MYKCRLGRDGLAITAAAADEDRVGAVLGGAPQAAQW